MQILMKVDIGSRTVDIVIGTNPEIIFWIGHQKVKWEQVILGMSRAAIDELCWNIQFLYHPEDLCKN